MTREEAISALKNTAWIGTDKKVGEVEKAIMMAIEALKAQDVPDTNVGSNDLISRQEAIELIECMKPYQQDADDICEMLQNMPSAQPEHTCVNCGRTVNNGGWYADGRTKCPIEEHYALPKDGYCHLWEKRNVTDDDYPERRTDEQTD